MTGPLLWEQPFGEVELPPGDDPLVLVAPSTSQDPEDHCCAPRSRGSPASRCACWPTTNRRAPARAAGRARERPARRLALLRPHDAALRRGDLPRRPRHGRARARLRRARAWPARTPATWPRTPRGCAGRASACRCRAASTPRAACASRCGGCSPSPPTRSAPGAAARVGRAQGRERARRRRARRRTRDPAGRARAYAATVTRRAA